MRAAVVAQTTERNNLLVLASDNQTARPSVRTTTGIAATRCASDNLLLLLGSLLVTNAPVTMSKRVQTATAMA
jgi:hypothetical protein